MEDEFELLTDDELALEFVGDAMAMYLKEIRKYPILSKAETYKLAKMANEGDKDARQKLINSNLRLVVNVAKNFKNRINHMDMLDVIQYGNEGLIKAIDRYNPEKSALTTYAIYWIKQSIDRNLAKDDVEISTSDSVYHSMRKYIAIINECKKRNEEIPSDEELCKQLNVTSQSLQHIKNTAFSKVISINKKYDNGKDGDESELGDFIADKSNNYDDSLNNLIDHELLVVLKENMSPHLYYILYKRIIDEKEHTFEEIGNELSITRERVRQLEIKAKDAAKPLIAGLNRRKKADAIIEKEGAYFYKIKTAPVEPSKIITYIYLKNYFQGIDLKILYELLLGEYVFTNEEMANYLNISLLEYKTITKQVISKSKELLKDKKKYSRFANDIKKTYGSRIFEVDLTKEYKVIDYEELASKFNSLSYEEILDLYGDDYDKLPNNSKILLEKYFKIPDCDLLTKEAMEMEVNLALFNFKDKSIEVLPSKLYKTYLDNLDLFTDEQQLFLECYVFNKKNIKEFKDKYPNSILRKRRAFLLDKLEKAYFNLNNMYYSPTLTKEMYEEVLKNYRSQLSEDRIKALNLYYFDNLSIQEIADVFKWENGKTRDFVRNARDHCFSLYLNRSNKKIVNKDIYEPYILNPAYELSESTRELLKYYVIDEMDYEQLSEMTGINRTKLSNTITEALRKLDYYRFGLLKATFISLEDFNNFFLNYKNSFSALERKIIQLRFIEHISAQDISDKLNVDKTVIHKVNKHFNDLFIQFQIKNVELSDEDYVKEIRMNKLESVLDDEEKKLISLYRGISCPMNLKGKKYSSREITEIMNITMVKFHHMHKNIVTKIKSRKIGILAPEDIYIGIKKLDKLLNDIHLPISDKEREIICYTCELKGYSHKSFKELAKMYNENDTSVKRRYQRAIINIYKYLNKEIDGVINYEFDIEPILRYFGKNEQIFIEEHYKNGLSYEAIAKKYKISFNKIVSIFDNIDANIFDILNNPKKKRFDFDFAEKALLEPNIPYQGNIGIVSKMFKLAFGYDEMEKLSAPEIVDRLGLDINPKSVISAVNNLMISISKLKDGIKKSNEFSFDEVRDYYLRHEDEISATRAKFYLNYFKRIENRITNRVSCKVNNIINFDLIKENYPNYFDLNNVSRDEVIQFLKKYRFDINKRVRDCLMQLFAITEREFMNGQDINHIYRLFHSLNKKLENEEIKSLTLT